MSKDYTWDYSNAYEWMGRVGKMDPIVITVCINGGVQGKEANPAIPEKPDEIAQSALDAYNAGASEIHIHARNPERLYDCTAEMEVFREINMKVREKCPDIIINNTSGHGIGVTMEERYRCLDAKPEMASLNMGPDMSRFKLAPRPAPLEHPHDGLIYDDCTPYTYGIIEKLAAVMKEKGIKPEMEMYNPGNYWVSQELIRQNLIEPPYIFQYVMGYQTSIYPTPENLINMIRELPKNSIFQTIGIGKYQWIMTSLGIMLGGNVRVGLEDNIYLQRGVKLSSNAEAVEKAVRMARELGREIATPKQAREMLGISAVPSKY